MAKYLAKKFFSVQQFGQHVRDQRENWSVCFFLRQIYVFCAECVLHSVV